MRRRVARAAGPERIEPEWWAGAGGRDETVRDYYRIEDATAGATGSTAPACTAPAPAPGTRPAGTCMGSMVNGRHVAYAELQAVSNFSFLRGASHAEELVERAAALGLAAIGIADRNTLAGAVRAHVAAKAVA